MDFREEPRKESIARHGIPDSRLAVLEDADKFSAAQWLGLFLSFAGMVVAFGLPTPALDPRQASGDLMMVGACGEQSAH